MSKLYRNILITILYACVIAIIIAAYRIGEKRRLNQYEQWPGAVNTLKGEMDLDCPNGEIIWIEQSDAYGNDTSFPVCSDISE